jgi:hypothetical protein
MTVLLLLLGFLFALRDHGRCQGRGEQAGEYCSRQFFRIIPPATVSSIVSGMRAPEPLLGEARLDPIPVQGDVVSGARRPMKKGRG